MNCKGVAHTYADHVDTDVIIPARTLNNPDPAALALHCMEDLDPTFVSRVRPGDLVVGGLNFGCGSSREHAPIALRACGISCVIAKSFARIFFRNAINIGLPVLTCPEAADGIHSGDQLHVVLETGLIHNLTTGESFTAAAFPPFMRELIAAGGLIGYTKAKLREGR